MKAGRFSPSLLAGSACAARFAAKQAFSGHLTFASVYPKWILFETNGMNDETFGAGTERSTVQALLDKGYELSYGGGFRDTGKRDTVLRRKW
ncbi:hypothetical protein AK812_SmicGene31177 [Symbiodinium microadriaticum]|uniref:Uncharacterized protein n=1 Tax=Symbiodinium microadriaticum TaxID=2951 RepID=A0A1Q9CXG2_SYMMI|nr:hypothetical protein AK812_SmicGene31177 [Symbiodinium microadriaticum]